MKITRFPPFLAVAFLWIQNGLCQDKYTDETRPYKFGFNIQGYQHRQEEKDERGLIKGEYGFITADGYYRVTVYATDENGDFRIISMKNYYVGFPPEDPQTTPQPESARGQVRKNEPLPDVLTSKPGGQRERGGGGRGGAGPGPGPGVPGGRGGGGRKKEPVKPIGQTGCSDCVIPTTKKPGQEPPGFSPRDEFNPPIDIRTGGLGGISRGGGSGFQDEGGRRDPSFGSQPPGRGRGSTRFPGSDRGNVNGVDNFRGGNVQNERGGPQRSRGGANNREGQDSLQFPNGGRGGDTTGSQFPDSGRGGDRTGPQFPGGGRGSTTGAGRGKVTDSAGFDEPHRNIGSVRDGLPKGVTVDDIKALLYRFNYTVGFHGHHEDGYRNGDKEGDYFFDGRDGVERRVEYIANEFGYQPNITFIDLPENDERRPNELTEKEYGLKGYEFKWFYRK